MTEQQIPAELVEAVTADIQARLNAWPHVVRAAVASILTAIAEHERTEVEHHTVPHIAQSPAEWAAGLADDEALVQAFREGWEAADARGESGSRVKAGLRALAAALAERACRNTASTNPDSHEWLGMDR